MEGKGKNTCCVGSSVPVKLRNMHLSECYLFKKSGRYRPAAVGDGSVWLVSVKKSGRYCPAAAGATAVFISLIYAGSVCFIQCCFGMHTPLFLLHSLHTCMTHLG